MNQDNAWGYPVLSQPVFADEVARTAARGRVYLLLEEAGIEVHTDLLAEAPDQVLYKLSTATPQQVHGILMLDAQYMIQQAISSVSWATAQYLQTQDGYPLAVLKERNAQGYVEKSNTREIL